MQRSYLDLNNMLKQKIEELARKRQELSHDPYMRAYTNIFMTFDIVDTYIRTTMGEDDSSRAGRSVLYILIENGGSMTATEISKRAWRSKFATTRVIDTLEKDGYVTRHLPDAGGDRRKKTITITEKGVQLFEKSLESTANELCPRILGGLTEDQVIQCYRILEHIGKHTYELMQPQISNSYLYPHG